MNDHDLERVIDEVLDGVATPLESDWLKQRLERDPSARSRYEERRVLFRSLDAGELVAPPSDLLPAVMAEIRSGAAQAPAASGWWSALRESLARRPALGLSYAIGAGAAMGALITVALIERSSIPPTAPLPVNGTMVSPATGPRWTVEDHVQLAAGPARGEVTLDRSGGILVAEIQSDSPSPSRWVLEFDPASLRAMALDRARGPEGALSGAPGRLEIETGTGSLTRVRFESTRPGDAELRVTLKSGSDSGTGVLHARAHARASP